jgi:DnaJ like chaperone protein
MKWLYILLALLYTLFPYDLLPDFLTGLGWVDDLIVLGFLVRFLYLQWGKARSAGHTGTDGTDQRNSRAEERTVNGEKRSASRFESTDPFTVLGVDRSASEAQIKKTYRELVGRYHPDKVDHLGEEFKTLAEERFKQIQQAYQKILQVRR